MATNKKAEGKPKASAAAMGVLILLLIGVFFYVISAPPEEKEKLLWNDTYSTENLLLSKSNIHIEASPEEDTSKSTYWLQNVYVDYTPQTNSQTLSTELSISRSFFSENFKSYNVDFTKTNVTRVYLTADIADENDGTLLVFVNDKEIYSSSPNTGESIQVNVPLIYLVEGLNKIDFKVALSFFSKIYVLSNVNFIYYQYSDATAEKIQLLNLKDTDIDSATLTTMLKQQSANPAELTLTLNDDEVISGILPADLEVDLPITSLKAGLNELKWKVAKDGAYDIKLGKVAVESTTISSKAKKYTFTIDATTWTKIAARTYRNCELYIKQESGTSDIRIKLNSYNLERSFANGEIKESVCQYLKQFSNTIALSAEEDIDIEKLTLRVS